MALRPPAAKRKLVADKALSTLTYSMKHPMHNWEGVSREVNCAAVYDDEARKLESVAVSARVASFNSRNENRDSHALEVLEALKYPNVTFVSQSVQPNADGSLTVAGRLTFHNVTRPVTVQATRKEAAGKMTVEGNFDVNLSDYKIERPSLMMMPVDDKMNLKFVIVFPI